MPSAFDNRTQPCIVRSLCTQQFNIFFVVSIFGKKLVDDLSCIDLFLYIPRYLTVFLTFMPCIDVLLELWTVNISHFFRLIERPEAFEKSFKVSHITGTWSSFFKNRQVSSASWLIIRLFSPIFIPSMSVQCAV